MLGLNPEQIWQYGAVLFTFSAAVLLLREFIIMFKTKIKEILINTEINKGALVEITKNFKDVAVIHAQTLDKIAKGDEKRDTFWHKMLESMEIMCGILSNTPNNMNGMKKGFQKQQEDMKVQHADMTERYDDSTQRHDDMGILHDDMKVQEEVIKK